ncbi:MAG TPA: TIGR03792 family protein [Leptolyngbyaceae cyanobacterium M33_DOE_097]|uniref:TIGR03792 family protein n=1 Tax=Oscillatoriales cyanobacterium SpSt-418 TaxID=2282169 RepID=A0A7C3PFA0_9CYAN|nr:TIGR03792 family protein [Leptolyngbyaceae cyanobacterium M33_DOE_097]
MVIEWLKFKVDPNLREKFIQLDEEIWTTALASYPGYLGKEVWLDPSELDAIAFVIRWATRENWKSIPQAALDKVEASFAKAMGQGNYKLVEAKEYQIRKFLRKEE